MMDTNGFTPAESLQVRDLETLKIIADSRRTQIVDVLRRKAATVKELAAALQVPPKSLYYHVNLLEKHGLIQVVDTRLVSGILEKRYRATAYLFSFSEIMLGPAAGASQHMLEAASSVMAITRDEMQMGLESGLIDTAEVAPADSRLSLGWDLLRLSMAQRDEMEERLEALFDEYSTVAEDTPDAQTYRYLFVMLPTDRSYAPSNPETGQVAKEASS